jgi:hypothetical protein
MTSCRDPHRIAPAEGSKAVDVFFRELIGYGVFLICLIGFLIRIGVLSPSVTWWSYVPFLLPYCFHMHRGIRKFSSSYRRNLALRESLQCALFPTSVVFTLSFGVFNYSFIEGIQDVGIPLLALSLTFAAHAHIHQLHSQTP